MIGKMTFTFGSFSRTLVDEFSRDNGYETSPVCERELPMKVGTMVYNATQYYVYYDIPFEIEVGLDDVPVH